MLDLFVYCASHGAATCFGEVLTRLNKCLFLVRVVSVSCDIIVFDHPAHYRLDVGTHTEFNELINMEYILPSHRLL